MDVAKALMILLVTAMFATSAVAQSVDDENLAVEAPQPTIPALLKFDENASLKCVQRSLNALGYDAGPHDGLMGGKTRNASMEFLDSGIALADYPELSSTSAFEWCEKLVSEFIVLAPIAGAGLTEVVVAELMEAIFSPAASILVSEMKPDDLAAELNEADSEAVFDHIKDIAAQDVGFLTTQTFNRSVVFILNGMGLRGATVKTTWAFRLLPNGYWYRDENEYSIDRSVPSDPLIIVNSTFASVAGQFLYEVYVNDRKIAERYVEVK